LEFLCPEVNTKVWDVATARLLKETTDFDPDKEKGFDHWFVRMCSGDCVESRDGKLLARMHPSGAAWLVDTATGKVKVRLRGHKDPVMAFVFSPDGKTLASGGMDHTVRLWDVATGKERAVLRGHTDWVFSVDFSPDGRLLASGSHDGVRLWDVPAILKARK
jgi:WD40 repeat protein